MKQPLISIITPTHNRAVTLKRAIESVQQQTLTDYEHIIIDDCSTDHTETLVERYSDARIRYVRFDRWRGANPARNVGIELAQSELISFLDSDDEFLPHRIESIVSCFQRQPSVNLILSSFETIKQATKGDGRSDAINPEVFLDGPELEFAIMAYAIFIAGSSISVRKSTIQQSGGFEPTLLRMQDREALLRLSQVCGAQLLRTIDWRKHVSVDSISRPRKGYVESLGRLLETHPKLSTDYRPLVTYHIARHILCDLIHGRLGAVRASMLANEKSTALQASLLDLAFGYRDGSVLRGRIKSSLSQIEKPEVEPETDSHEIPFELVLRHRHEATVPFRSAREACTRTDLESESMTHTQGSKFASAYDRLQSRFST